MRSAIAGLLLLLAVLGCSGKDTDTPFECGDQRCTAHQSCTLGGKCADPCVVGEQGDCPSGTSCHATDVTCAPGLCAIVTRRTVCVADGGAP